MKNTYCSKILRIFTAFLPSAKNKVGKCIRCGSCCKLPNKCLFLIYERGIANCLIYPIRPLNCRKYPRNEKEYMTKHKCGFRFKK